jgi:hypothetical protein
MPQIAREFKLRKAPKNKYGDNAYWVISKVTNRHFSKEPMTKENAKQQLKALYASQRRQLKGGYFNQQMFDNLMKNILSEPQYQAKIKKLPLHLQDKQKSYTEYRAEAERINRQRASFDPQQHQRDLEQRQAEINATNQAYIDYYAQFPEEEPVMCNIDENLEKKKSQTTMGECKRRHQKRQEKIQAEAETPISKALGSVVSGLTKGADIIYGDFGDVLPAPLKAVGEVYKTFAPPGSRFYDGGAIAELEGAGFFTDFWEASKTAFDKAISQPITKSAEFIKEKVQDVRKGVRQDYPPKVRRLLKQIGDYPINEAYVRRDPIQSTINKALNLITFGKWDEVRKKYAYDKLFHLGLEVYVETPDGVKPFVIEKNQVINVEPAKPRTDQTEFEKVNLGSTKTLHILLDAGKSVLRDKFFTYDAFYNNCQNFIMAILQGEGLLTGDLKTFILQPVDKLVEELPSYTSKIARAVTDVAALADVAIEGRGHKDFHSQLKDAGISEKTYLAKARKKAREAGLNAKRLEFSTDPKKKLQILAPCGKIIRFGATGHTDYIMNTIKKSPDAEKKRKSYLARATKIKGEWKETPYSPNSLAIKILW